MRTFAALSLGGLGSILLMKLLAIMLAPMLKWVVLLVGFFFMVLKVLLIAGVVYFLYSLVFKRKREREASA